MKHCFLRKQGVEFWKCWKSKFECTNRPVSYVNGVSDAETIAEKFAAHFANTCTSNTITGANRLKNEYSRLRRNYHFQPLNDRRDFDAELVETVIVKMHRGKAAGLDGLRAEHLQYSHPLLPCVLAKLFNLMLRLGHVPRSFGNSYTVPIFKSGNNTHSKSATVNDFRGISISHVLSKVLEHCILDRYNSLFATSDNQFGFKKHSGCSHAVYLLRCVTDFYVSSGWLNS